MKIIFVLSLFFILGGGSVSCLDINKYTPENLSDFKGREINDFLWDIGEDYDSFYFIDDPPGRIKGCAFIFIDWENNIGYRFDVYIASTNFIKQVFSLKYDWDVEEVKKELIGYITVKSFVPEKDYIYNDEVEQFLIETVDSLFPELDYYHPGRPLNINGRKIYFIFHLIDKDEYIFDCAAAYSFFDGADGALQGLLTIKDFCIINSNNSVLFDFSKDDGGIYGFKIPQFNPDPEIDEYTPELNIDIYFYQGKRIGDSVKIIWNENKRIFERSEK